MKTILQIFLDDIRSICGHFFVLVIVIAVIVLPALYAWVNIYANHDPYVNTGNIPVAVASHDPGAYQDDGSYVNAAREITDELKDDDKIGWVFPDTQEKAVEGVRSGKYYAAIVFEDNFTYNMCNLKETLAEDEPSVTYYTNTKKNAVASKITDTAASNLLEKINTRYLQALFDQIFQGTNKLSDDLDSSEAVDKALQQLRDTRDALHDYNATIDLFYSSSDDITKSLKQAEKNLDTARSNTRSSAAKAKESIQQAQRTAKALEKSLNRKLAELGAAIDELVNVIEKLEQAVDTKEIQKLAKEAEQKAQKVLSILKEIRALIPDTSQSDAVKIVRDTLDLLILDTEETIHLLQELQNDPSGDIKALLEVVRTLVDTNNNELVPAVERMISDIDRAIRVAKPLLTAAGGILDGIDPVLESAGGTVNSLDGTLLRLQVVLTSLEEHLNEIIAQVESADTDDQLALLTDLLGGDPDQYSKFFSSLVKVNQHEIYSIDFYGAAMTPFYTILAIWVGGVILVSLLRTKVNRRKFPQITENQGFFGRFIIFFLLGQMQAAVVVLGDIFLLHVNPVHPWLMWFAVAVASLAFTLLIYALVLSFGDIGKAIVVVVMVLQIAGSSGSYPIEILPVIYDKIFLFFPFPYAINAMREALCGLYQFDYLIYLGQLLIFGVLGLVIGLLVRKPFIGINRFVTEKLEETEVL